MARLSLLLDDLRMAAYGAPDPVLQRSLRRAASAFCSFSQAWRDTLPVIRLREGLDRYQLLAPDGSHVERIVFARLDGRGHLAQARPDEVFARRPSAGTPRLFAQHDQDVVVWPVPDAGDVGRELTVYGALSVSMTGAAIPDGLLAEFGDVIVHRAKWDLLTNDPEMPWHNPATGAMHLALADEGFQRAKRVQHSGHHTLLTVQPRPFI